MTKLHVAGLLVAGTLAFGGAETARTQAPAGHEIRDFGQTAPQAVDGAAAGAGTTPADRVDTLGGLLGPIVSGTGDLSSSRSGSAEPSPTTAPATAATGGDGPSTLDRLLDDVDAAAAARCTEIARTDAAGLDRAAADLDRRRDEELARLSGIERDGQRLATLQGEIDALGRQIADREQGMSPEDETRRRAAETLRSDLDAARTELDRRRFELRQLMERHEALRARREAFAAASENLRGATARIDALTRDILTIRTGDRATVTNRFGDAAYVRHHVQDLERQLADARQIRAGALAEAGEALFLPRPPTSLAELAEGTSALHGEWQRYHQQHQAIETRLRWLEAERIPALLRELAAAEEADTAAAARRRDLAALKDQLQQRRQDYERIRDAAAVDRVAAVLAFKLDAAIRDCIDRRRVAGSQGPAPAAAGWPQTATGTVTRTCYGPTTGESVELGRRFIYDPWAWRVMSIRIHENNAVDFGGLGGSIYGGTNLYKNDASGRQVLDRGSGHLDPATGRMVLRAEGRGGFNTLQGEGASLKRVRTDTWPVVFIGELRPDPSAPTGWRGKGRGQIGFKLTYRTNFGPVHASEPCEVEWTVP